MKLKRFILAAVLTLGLFCHSETIEEMLARPIPQYHATRTEILVGRSVVEMMTKMHYNAQRISPKVSSDWFTEYLRCLDFQHIYFLQGDIDEFRSFETVLWDARRKVVNLDFAYNVYARFLRRVHERAVFSIGLLNKKMDFSEKDSMLLDREDCAAPANKAEQEKLWAQLVKHEVLSMMMDDEKEARKVASGEKKPSKNKKTLEERIEKLKKSYASYYSRRIEKEMPGVPKKEISKVFEIFLTSLCYVYDPHSNYMAPATKKNFDIDMSLSLQGIGATLTIKDAYVTVVELVPGGPADKDGRLGKNDKIVAVAQEGKEPVDVVDMPLDDVVSLIRGPKGTKVTLTIIEKGSSSETQITITRDEVKLEDKQATSEIKTIDLGDGRTARVLVMNLPSFYCDFAGRAAGKKDYKSTTRDMLALLDKAKAEGSLDGVIMDLRGNGGGSLDEAISLGGLFDRRAPIVQIREANGKIERRFDESTKAQFQGPLIVMTDHFSASASEIVAAALQDSGRALVVGDKVSHGKGTVQSTIDIGRMMRTLPNVDKREMGSVKMTIAKFYRINGGSTQLEGVKPQIVFPSFTDYMKTSEDTLPHALPWDEIRPIWGYKRFYEVEKLLPALQEKSKARLANSADYQDYLKTVAIYGAFKDLKEIPLDLEGRRNFVKKQEEAEKVLHDFRRRLNIDDDEEDEDEEVAEEGKPAEKKDAKARKKDKKKGKDVILEETLSIMGDFIKMHEENKNAEADKAGGEEK